MLAIFQYCGQMLTDIMKMWQGISLGGFRPFWYFIGLGLLTVFGFFLRGLLFSGAAGSAASGLVSKVGVKTESRAKSKSKWRPTGWERVKK